ncbi:ADP-ribosyltransferase [Aeromonas veronii]
MQDVLSGVDFDQIMNALSDKTCNLNNQEKKYVAAIYHYTENGYSDINSHLRGTYIGDSKIKKTINYIDSALKWLGDYDPKRTVVRYSDLNKEHIEIIKKPRSVIYIPSYTSTSANINFKYHTKKRFKFIIYRDKGSFIGDYSYYPHEEEVLIPRSSFFKVLEFDESSNLVYLKQIDTEYLRLAVRNNNEV